MKDAGRLVYTLTTMSPAEAKDFAIEEEQRKSYIRMDSAKVNITRHSGSAKWFKLIGVPLDNGTEMYPNGDEVQTVERWTPPQLLADLSSDLINRILTDIDAGSADGERYSDAAKATSRAAWRVITKHAPQKTEDQARRIIKTWVGTGLLEGREYDSPTEYKKLKGLFVIHAKRRQWWSLPVAKQIFLPDQGRAVALCRTHRSGRGTAASTRRRRRVPGISARRRNHSAQTQ